MKDDLEKITSAIEAMALELEGLTLNLNRVQTIKIFKNYLDRNLRNFDKNTLQVLVRALQTSNKHKETILYSKKPDFILVRMNASYEAALGLEYFLFNRFEDPLSIREQYPSTATPISILHVSPRLERNRIVALFPENWDKNFRSELESMPVYYFLNRFRERYLIRTQPIIAEKVDGNIFKPLLKADLKEIDLCANIWVSLHEYFHTHSALPLPRYLSHKASKEAGAFEELRADLNVISELSKIARISTTFLNKVRGYVLAKRLFYYGSNFNPNNDYDAISSQMLFGCLKAKGILQLSNDRVVLNEEVWECIDELKTQFNQIERSVQDASAEDATLYFSQKSRELGRYLPKDQKYHWIDPYPRYFQFLESLEINQKTPRITAA